MPVPLCYNCRPYTFFLANKACHGWSKASQIIYRQLTISLPVPALQTKNTILKMLQA
jgi:hypothetical protein